MALVTFLGIGLTLYAVLDVALSDAAEQRVLPKAAWLATVLVLPFVGPLAWFVLGRPPTKGPATGGSGSASSRPAGDDARRDHPSWGTARPSRTRRAPDPPRPQGGRGVRRAPRGPDDDPEFLRALDERLRRQGDEP
jgi:hypothetical protein